MENKKVEEVNEVEEALMVISEDIMQGLQKVYEIVVRRNGMKNENRTIH